MKKMILTVLMFLPALVHADWHNFSLPDWSNGAAVPNGGRCYINGQWCAGVQIDMLDWQIPGTLNGKPLPKLSLSLNHEYNAAELFDGHGAGLWGPSIGLDIGGLATKIQKVINFGINFIHETGGDAINPPAWLVNDVDKYISIETGVGYRLFGHRGDVKPWDAWVGGKLVIPFDLFKHH